MPVVPTAAALPCLTQAAPTASQGDPYNQLTEENIWTWFTDGFLQYAGTTQK